MQDWPDLPLQARKAVGRAMYSTDQGQRTMLWHRGRRIKQLALREAAVIIRLLFEDPTHLCSFEYDNSTSPPTYGDLFQVLMLARYLSLSGLKVEFVFVDSGNRRSDWMALSSSDQDSFLLEQVDLARALLPAPVAIRIAESRLESSSGLTEGGSYRILSGLLDQGSPIYPATPSLLDVLARSRQLTQPSGFLLDKNADNTPISPLPPVTGPYVAWHVRQGYWNPDRDSTDAAMIRDFQELRQLFPSHSIMLFSTGHGIERALAVLEKAHLLDSMRDCRLSITGQPVPGFVAAIPYILNADFYFQRLGGGIAMVPIFSYIPYLILNGDANYYFSKRGSRLVPWANARQKFVVSPYTVKSMTIKSGLTSR